MKSKTTPVKSFLLLAVFLIIGSGLGLTVQAGTSPPAAGSRLGTKPEPAARELSIKLIGTIVSANRPDSVVIVASEGTGRQWLLREGDQLGSLTIKHIQPDHVTVAVAQGEFEVRMQRNLRPTTATFATTSQTASLSANSGKNGPRSRLYRLLPEDIKMAAARLEATMKALEATPGKLFNQDKGVRISALEPDSIFADMGMRPGDLVLRVNDKAVHGKDDLASLLTRIQAEGEAALTLRRRARTYSFSLELR